ncbi:hypothetical protein LLG90_25015 [Aromatoleum toluclasticum]|uniref:hypothetical protein n=1 Tax=Aromatoleum toluclasticum TaxID=92003 RepID=UPI001D17FED2|nr:hypothetical protein [Aromatoleum toluclasticum]MCC4118624.1 hypothetical protein [Aromatoleum toluclasticum]
MDLIPGGCFRLQDSAASSTELCPGVYRVILDDPASGITIAVLIIPDEESLPSKGGRKKKPNTELKSKRRKAPPPLVGDLRWIARDDLVQLDDDGHVHPFEVVRRRRVRPLGERDQQLFKCRTEAMAPFLDDKELQQWILIHRSLKPLINHAAKSHGVSTNYIYRQWSNLCRWGFDKLSLMPGTDRCGAPGGRRPCIPGVRQKAGRKTREQRIARAYKRILPPFQPGYSAEWAAAIRAADSKIPDPKPKWPRRCELIIASAFCGKAEEIDGRIEYAKPALGTYPNNRQIQRILTECRSILERIREQTTKHHFKAALRGLVARNWQGIAGPGHAWAIDSTIGDIFLRSSVNRAWLIGRPVVYIVVDIWSTAIVGFYVCLTGPSWATARVSIFNACADPHLVGEVWGYQAVLSLSPTPTICHTLLCDRGEYLSQGHRTTAIKLIPHSSYTPPYRGDLKGVVEVLHRITKDEQFFHLPGAMDYRRQELELRKIDPADCTMTVQNYVQYLYEIFAEYNLTADRRHRVDAHMEAVGVYPSPAGLWAWGHAMGIGYRKYTPADDLITKLLPEATARVRRDGVRYAGCDYTSAEIEQEQWTTIARNRSGWDIPIHYYPGPMRSIWTPDDTSRLLKLTIRDDARASPETTRDEWLDCLASQTMRWPYQQHENMMTKQDHLARIRAIEQEARRKTEEAIARAKGATPTMTEARVMDVAATEHPSGSEKKAAEDIREEANEAHQDMIAELLRSADYDQ